MKVHHILHLTKKETSFPNETQKQQLFYDFSQTWLGESHAKGTPKVTEARETRPKQVARNVATRGEGHDAVAHFLLTSSRHTERNPVGALSLTRVYDLGNENFKRF